ncbi:MAG TPA: hypothetical protein VNK91_02135 [Burkholderiaceae bacterium]|nr:hypothetical protein [Burkholderiaceae bacterium]
MAESRLLRDIQLAAADRGVRLFRNNTGNGYVGTLVRRLPSGEAVLRDWRRIQFGLCPGSADLIGWRSLTITPDMVGKRIAQVVAIEAKTGDTRATAEQLAFLRAVLEAGGVSGIARSVAAARALIYE